MNVSKIAIAAISWARNPTEEQLIEDALRVLSQAGAPLFVVDGGSPDDFLHRLRSIEGISVFESQQRGLLNHVVESLVAAAASGREFILYTEADKHWFFQHRLAEFFDRAPDGDDVGTVFPSRDPDSFLTFPTFQHYMEHVINYVSGLMINQPGEYTYGPRLVRASLVPYLQRLNRDVGWGWQSYLLAISHRLGQRIVEVPLDLPCPEEQRSEAGQSTHLFRLTQLANHLDGLLHGLTVGI